MGSYLGMPGYPRCRLGRLPNHIPSHTHTYESALTCANSFSGARHTQAGGHPAWVCLGRRWVFAAQGMFSLRWSRRPDEGHAAGGESSETVASELLAGGVSALMAAGSGGGYSAGSW